jgi:hypothetical protein
MADLPLCSTEQAMRCKTLPKDSDEEATFLHNICGGFEDLKDIPSSNISELDTLTSTLHTHILSAFEDNAKLSNIICHSTQTSVTHQVPIRSAVMHTHTGTRQSLEERYMPHQAQATHVTHATEDPRQP